MNNQMTASTIIEDNIDLKIGNSDKHKMVTHLFTYIYK